MWPAFMRRARTVVFLLTFILSAAIAGIPAARAYSHGSITAKSAILIDTRTGEILWQRNPDLPLPPASTTKIVTALLALESGRLDDSLNVTAEAALAPASKISLRPGWRMRLRDLVYAVLLNSANDASVVIAEGLSGSVRDFAQRMNAEARTLGATNTHFVNPNGLPAADHYTTARDLATMFSRAMENPLFEKIVNTKTTAVSPSAGSSRIIALRNHNRLLGNYRIHVVGKTGWTIAARKCFVGAASAEGRELVVAVLGSNDLWGDLKRLIEFGFNGTAPPAEEAAEFRAVASTAPTAVGDDEENVNAPADRYSVRLATFRSFSSATNLRNSIARDGYPVRVEQLAQGRRRLYRVSVGTYGDRRAAQQAATKLRKTHRQLTQLVVARS